MTLAETVARIPAKWPDGIKDFRVAAATVAMQGWGPSMVREEPIFVNLGALALAMGTQPLIHELRQDALNLIESTDLRSVPREPPALLRSALIIEAGGACLFGSTTDLGIYQVPDGRYGILGYTGRDMHGDVVFALWKPRWTNDDLTDPNIIPPVSPDELEPFNGWAQDAIRFVLIYGLLLEAEKTPIVAENKPQPRKRSVKIKDQEHGRSGWVRRYISLTTRPVTSHESQQAIGEGTDGRVARWRQVTGHLKRQVFGPGRSGRRWIYVEAFESRRWMAPAPRMVIVKK